MAQKPLTKLLFVDDDLDILSITKYCLEKLKEVESRFVSSGKEAIREALDFKPDLIFLDVMMPVMDGVATLNAMRQIEAIAHIPVVLFTAKVQKEEIDSYMHLGVLDVILKPFDPLTLGSAIQKIWVKYQNESS